MLIVHLALLHDATVPILRNFVLRRLSLILQHQVCVGVAVGVVALRRRVLVVVVGRLAGAGWGGDVRRSGG